MIGHASARLWAMSPQYEPAALSALRQLQAVRAGDRIAGAVWLDEAEPGDLYAVSDGVALIGVYGLLVDELPYHGASFATGYNGIRLAAMAALDDPAVKALALVTDSGGGMVAGCFELVEWLRGAALAARKPLVAIVRHWAASAAYAIACAADSIACPLTGGVGSIGVVRMHIAIGRALDDMGVDVTLVHAGAHKVDGHPFAALPDPVRAEWQEDVEAYRRLFADQVARGRPMDVEAALATEARFYEGPSQLPEALRLGLLDAIVNPDDALAMLAAHVNAPRLAT